MTGAEGAAAAGPAASTVADFYPQELQPLAQELVVFGTESPPQQRVNSRQVHRNSTKKMGHRNKNIYLVENKLKVPALL